MIKDNKEKKNQVSKINYHANHRERMRERVRNSSLESLAEHEILEFLLYPFIPRKDTNPIAHELIATFGSLSAVFESEPEALQSVKGMTKNAALYLSCMSHLSRMYSSSKVGERPKLETMGQIVDYLMSFMNTLQEERIYAICIDSAGRLKERCELGRGDSDDCRLKVKELVMLCHNSNTKYVYLAHNHPSGIAKPSFKDIEFTKWAATAFEVMGITLIDHIIIAKNDFYSFLKHGKLENFKKDYLDFLNNEKVSDRRG